MTEPTQVPRAADYRPDGQTLAGKIILVTGAGDGIGAEAAKTYARYGATVVLLGRTTAKLEAVYDEICAAEHPEPAIYPLNLGGAVMKDYDDLAATLEREFGKLDGLLHNASVLGERKSIAQTKVDNWQQVMDINLNAAFMLTKACLPLMQQAERASLVFTSSGVGRKGRAYWGAYAVSKFATEGLMQVLADEMEGVSEVRVNSLNPGATNTAMRRTAYPGEAPDNNPLPAEIMPLYVYLMSDDSAGVNGQALNAQD